MLEVLNEGVVLILLPGVKVERILLRQFVEVILVVVLIRIRIIGDVGAPLLERQDIRRLSQVLEPRSRIAIDGGVRRFAGYVNLELQSPKNERFHRIYKGSHPTRRDRVVLHLYDLSASDDKNAAAKARREFDRGVRVAAGERQFLLVIIYLHLDELESVGRGDRDDFL